MGEIVDHWRDCSAVTKENGSTWKHSNYPKKTTKGWEVLIEWKYETTIWVDIKDVNEAKPIDLSEYVVIDDEPAFAWWMPYNPKKSDIIIS